MSYTKGRMKDCRTIRQEPKSVISASVVNHREGRRRFRIVPGALIYGWRPHPSTHRIKKSDIKATSGWTARNRTRLRAATPHKTRSLGAIRTPTAGGLQNTVRRPNTKLRPHETDKELWVTM